MIAAGALHDTVEKTATHDTDLRKHFGRRITTLVLAVTDDDQITDYHQRKAAEREQAASAGDEALMILAADKVSKVRELQLETATGRRRSTPVTSHARLRPYAHYRECLQLLERHLPDSPLVAKLHAETERLPNALTHHPLLTGTAV